MTVELIAECSTNHGGSMALAHEFIQRFAEAGATFIKFQLTRVAHLRKDDPQREWFTKAELSEDQFAELKAATEAADAQFLLTVYNAADVPILTRLGIDIVKVGSGEANESPLAQALRPLNARIIVGCGLTSPQLTPYWTGPFRADYLHCATRYPCPSAYAIMPYVAHNSLGFFTGWSDHAIGLEGCYLAILNGARIIEKHVHLIGQARMVQPWEASTGDFKRLRQFADDNPAERYLGRWQA